MYIFSLAGLNDEKKCVAQMITKLPSGLQYSISQGLAEETNSAAEVTLQKFQDLLVKLTEKTLTEVQAELKNASIDNCNNYRDLYYNIFGLTSQTLPANKQNDTVLVEHLATQNFKISVPKSVRDNINFKMSKLTGVKLADYASEIAKLGNSTNSNFLRTQPKNGQKSNFKPNFNKNGNFQQNGYRQNQNQWNKHQNSKNVPKSQNNNGPNFQKNQTTCFFCGIRGHIWSKCYKLEKTKIEGIFPGNWVPPQSQNSARREPAQYHKN